MSRTALHCRSCGWTGEVDAALLPRFGARLRCEECSALLPLALAGEETPEPPAPGPSLDARSGASSPAGSPAAATPPQARASNPDRGTAVEAGFAGEPDPALVEIDAWLETLRRREGGRCSEVILWAEHSGDLARFYAEWRRNHPGTRAARAFRARLFTAMGTSADPSGTDRAPALGPARGEGCATSARPDGPADEHPADERLCP